MSDDDDCGESILDLLDIVSEVDNGWVMVLVLLACVAIGVWHCEEHIQEQEPRHGTVTPGEAIIHPPMGVP